MKLAISFLLVAVAFAVVSAGPAPLEPIKILKSSYDQDPEGSYRFGFETENNIVRDEVGELKLVKNEEGKDEQVVVMKGSYSYIDPNGTPITVVYYADETGFHAEGAHLPVAPKA